MLDFDKESFAVLFGSVSRGDYTKNSDIDILLYNYPEEKAKQKIELINLPDFPVNFVVYDEEMFWKFHTEGSLFLHHIFEQGKLIDGNDLKWNEIKQSFIVKKSFQEEINKIKREVLVYQQLGFLNGFYLSALVNIYPLLKNYCIFTLANQGVYEFNKRKCIKLKVADDNKSENLLQLQGFYDYSVRGLDISLEVSPNSLVAKNLVEQSYNFIRDIHDYQ